MIETLDIRKKLSAFVEEGSTLEEIKEHLKTSRELLDKLKKYVSHKRTNHALFYFLSDRDLL